MSKKLTEYCLKNNITKREYVKNLIKEGDFINAIHIVSSFNRLEKKLELVQLTSQSINQPHWKEILIGKRNLQDCINESIQVIKKHFKYENTR